MTMTPVCGALLVHTRELFSGFLIRRGKEIGPGTF
jgi:hypothetical protein